MANPEKKDPQQHTLPDPHQRMWLNLNARVCMILSATSYHFTFPEPHLSMLQSPNSILRLTMSSPYRLGLLLGRTTHPKVTLSTTHIC